MISYFKKIILIELYKVHFSKKDSAEGKKKDQKILQCHQAKRIQDLSGVYWSEETEDMKTKQVRFSGLGT